MSQVLPTCLAPWMIKGFLLFDFFHFDRVTNANRSILLFSANIQNNARINVNNYILLHENMCALSLSRLGHNDMIQELPYPTESHIL